MIKNAFLFFCGYLCFFYSKAQFINDNQVIAVTNGAIVSLNDMDALNKGSWINRGAIYLSNDWANEGEYQSTGSLILHGEAQEIDAGDAIFSNLFIDGGGEKAINSDLTITDTLHLINGLVVCKNDAAIKLAGEKSGLKEGSSVSYIKGGALYQKSSGGVVYPLGNETGYFPLFIQKNDSEEIGFKLVSDEEIAGLTQEPSIVTSSAIGYEVFSKAETTIQEIQLPVDDLKDDGSKKPLAIAYSDRIEALQVIAEGEWLTSEESEIVSTNPITLKSGIYVGVYKNEDLAPPIKVINVVTANNDGKHDFLRVENIDFYKNNTVEIFDRLGQKVFEMTNYDNRDRIFSGERNVNGSRKRLATGSYFYVIRMGNKVKNGFIYVKTD